ncbi:hypothetical protein NIES4071_11130 [Calothrix sp. NIES-4071]|nr:hypothetical protein NIES4071_11130 [Calothrix sp. NIES-4071]BAZ55453.1 hypothetical protein NIES4105_11090 [Calothrix sp. NIES-4105]
MYIEDILEKATDPCTHPDELYQIYDEHKVRGYKRQIIEAIGSNPNTSLELLEYLFTKEPNMADIVFDNPVMPLLILEDPLLVTNWFIQSHNSIFRYNKLLSLELQNIALRTENRDIILHLVESKTTAPSIIEEIAKRVNIAQNSVIANLLKKHPNAPENITNLQLKKPPLATV